MSNTIGNGKISGLIAYLENLSSKGKVKASAITPLKSATKTIFSIVDGEDWLDTDVRGLDIDDYVNRFKNLTIGQYDASSYGTYRARLSRAMGWYNNFLQDPGWAPTIKDRVVGPKKAKTTSTSTIVSSNDADLIKKETKLNNLDATNQTDISVTQNVSTKLISFPFPMSNGVIAALYLPQNISSSDAARLQNFIKTLVIDEETTNEAS